MVSGYPGIVLPLPAVAVYREAHSSIYEWHHSSSKQDPTTCIPQPRMCVFECIPQICVCVCFSRLDRDRRAYVCRLCSTAPARARAGLRRLSHETLLTHHRTAAAVQNAHARTAPAAGGPWLLAIWLRAGWRAGRGACRGARACSRCPQWRAGLGSQTHTPVLSLCHTHERGLGMHV